MRCNICQQISFNPDNRAGTRVRFSCHTASGITTRQYFDMSGRSVGYSETANNFTHSVGYAYDAINNLTQLVEDMVVGQRTILTE